jgi:BirA family biotin operon repressor/biotin-[acetyl-CoA-carboxylase] ligase
MAEQMVIHQNIHVKSVDSTNFLVKRLLEDDADRGNMVVSTEFQDDGKGHAGNSWESKAGMNCLFSVLIRDFEVEAASQFIVSKLTCLAIVDVVKQYLPEQIVKIKWPNDIYVGDKKLAGILIQNTTQGMFLKDSIIGIGLNVNQEFFESDAPNPISMKSLAGESFSCSEIIQEIVNRLVELTSVLYSDEILIHKRFHELLYSLDDARNYLHQGMLKVGVVKGVDEFGRLLLQFENELLHADFKEVELKL